MTQEQEFIRQTAREWARARSPVASFRSLHDRREGGKSDPALWGEICGMGWPGALVPEEFGGSGIGFLAMGAILEETARTLTASPLTASAVGGVSALLIAGSPEQKVLYLPELASGRRIAVLAADEGPRHTPVQTALKARADGSEWLLSGRKMFVPEGSDAQFFIVPARTEGQPGEEWGITLFIVSSNAPGLSVTPLDMVDGRACAHLTFNAVRLRQETVLGEASGGYRLLDRILDRLRAAVSAEMLGIASQAFEMTVDYLRIRIQFGKPIGTFQALQHRAAKMLIDIELARSAVEAALEALDEDDQVAPELVSLAKAKAGDALFLVSNEMIQMHGGIGMTHAHDSGLYLKRARVLEAMYGGRSFHEDRYATLSGF
jgi:alkylation response protein AidB-like acyl-CoA dehydrogenase